MVFSRQSITRNNALRNSGEPLFEVRTLLASWVPDWSASGSTPAKEVTALRWTKLDKPAKTEAVPVLRAMNASHWLVRWLALFSVLSGSLSNFRVFQ